MFIAQWYELATGIVVILGNIGKARMSLSPVLSLPVLLFQVNLGPLYHVHKFHVTN